MSDYVKQTWVDDETPVDAEHLNHMEDGIEAAGGIEHIKVNGVEQGIKDKTVNVEVPTKVSDLDNDSGYVTDSALDGYAKESDVEAVKETADSALATATEAKDSVPTKLSELENDVPYATGEELAEFDASLQEKINDTQSDVAALRANTIQAITLNGEAVPVDGNYPNRTAAITFDDVSNGSDGIKALTVDGDLFEYVDDVCDTIGVYFMRATSDTPNIPETAAFFIMLLRNSNTQATMIAFRAGSNTNTYMCKEQSSAWGDWTQIIPSGGSEPTYDADSETLIF